MSEAEERANQRKALLVRRLREIQHSDGVSTSTIESLVVDTSLESARSGPAQYPFVTPDALESWNKFEQNESLDENDVFNLESIVLGNGLRPAFDIQKDSYPALPSIWSDLNDQRGKIELLIKGIGRLDLAGDPSRTYAGTAFACGESLLMTNRHVARLFVEGVGTGTSLTFTPGLGASLDFKQEVGNSESIVIRVISPVFIMEEWDIAVIRVEPFPRGVQILPLAASPPAVLEDRMAAVIGYPAFDPAEDLVQQIQIFRSVFDKKRIQPGRLKGIKSASSFGKTVQALAHDCTTLGGNSGSAVIDISEAKVYGVHFGGIPLVSNYSVPTWSLAADSRLRGCGVQFST